MLNKAPGAHKVPIEKNVNDLYEIFELRKEVDDRISYIVQVDSPEELLKLLTENKDCETYIWNNEKGELVAYFTLIDSPKGDVFELISLRVSPRYQRQGHGNCIMEFVESIARKSSKKKVKLATSPENKPALSFYDKMGYRVVGKADDYYGDGGLRYILEKPIS